MENRVNITKNIATYLKSGECFIDEKITPEEIDLNNIRLTFNKDVITMYLFEERHHKTDYEYTDYVIHVYALTPKNNAKTEFDFKDIGFALFMKPTTYEERNCIWLSNIKLTDRTYLDKGIGSYTIKFLEELTERLEKKQILGKHIPPENPEERKLYQYIDENGDTINRSMDMYDKNGFINYFDDYYDRRMISKVVNPAECKANSEEIEGITVYNDFCNWQTECKTKSEYSSDCK